MSLGLPYPFQASTTSQVTGTDVAGNGVTVTLPAAGANLFHHIVGIEISKFAAAILASSATPILVTTTNLPGAPVFDFDADAVTQGTLIKHQLFPAKPIKSSAANTATTVVAPVTTSVIWRIRVWYVVGP